MTPFLELAPLRVEDLYFYPYVMIYKDGIYESESMHIKSAFLRCPSRNKFEEDGGISGCLIPESYSSVVQKLSVRMQDMAGLDNDMEGIFVIEYGSTSPFKLFQLHSVSNLKIWILTFHSIIFFVFLQLNLYDLEDVKASAILFVSKLD